MSLKSNLEFRLGRLPRSSTMRRKIATQTMNSCVPNEFGSKSNTFSVASKSSTLPSPKRNILLQRMDNRHEGSRQYCTVEGLGSEPNAPRSCASDFETENFGDHEHNLSTGTPCQRSRDDPSAPRLFLSLLSA